MNNLEDFKKILIKFGGWIALSVSVLMIIGAFISTADSQTEKKIKEIEKDYNYILKEMKNQEVHVKELPPFLDIVRKTWEKDTQKLAIVKQDFIYETAKEIFRQGVAPSFQWINLPSNFQINIEREKIDLSWSAPDKLIGDDGEYKDLADVAGYHLIKEWKADNKIQRDIIRLQETSYEDTEIEPKVTYSYKVRCWTNNTEAKGGEALTKQDITEFNLPKNIIVSKYTERKSGSILPLYDLVLKGVAGNTAFIELMKWEKGDWRKVSARIRKGEKIEKRAYIKELQKSIYFNPGWKLIGIRPNVKRSYMKEVRQLKIDPITKIPVKDIDGKLVYETKEEKVFYNTAAIRYQDEKGKIELKYQTIPGIRQN
ncbi:MAG: fibronectin type III domain-containing protein [Planctomycetes bacterium]|jgi:hypothetical protein|nr:fibronectin type III domain-containing protein [Planctomycetota bacterium]HPY75800.1 fibronectin type III domain-containing protein [Planctomycetota bacterium]HQB00599.1 fibronectin type III domain-containing protein [Planctomycetota bacterium]HRU51833.1 fibronectin type III domain-containing protein [Planctomycetota bacterium]